MSPVKNAVVFLPANVLFYPTFTFILKNKVLQFTQCSDSAPLLIFRLEIWSYPEKGFSFAA